MAKFTNAAPRVAQPGAVLALFATILVSGVLATTAAIPELTGSVAALGLGVLLLGLYIIGPNAAIAGAIIVGLTAGFSRRLIEYIAGESPLIPFVVVMPAVTVAAVWFSMSPAREPSEHVRLPGSLLLVALVVGISAVNPFGAGLATNLLTGALLAAAVGLAALVYRGLVAPSVLIGAMLVCGLANSLYVLSHDIFGMLPWDDVWVERSGYASLYVGPGQVRPLGIASSVAESAALSGVTAAVALAYFRITGRVYFLLLALVAALAVAATGVRTYFLLLLLAIVVAFVVGAKHPFRRLLVILSLGVPGVFIAATFLADSVPPGAARTLMILSGQEDPETSTIPLHMELAITSFGRGVLSLVGTGAGQLSVLTAPGLGSAETDLANVALTGGLVGVAAILLLWWQFARYLPITALASQRGAVYAAGLLATFSQWFNPGYYGILLVVWGLLGAYMREAHDLGALGDSRQGRPPEYAGRTQPLRRRLGGRAP